MNRVLGWLKIPLLLLALALALGLAIMLMPWQKVLEGQLTAMLSARGFDNVSLDIAGLGRDGLVLENITFGGEPPLILRNVALDYTLSELRQKRIGGLAVTGLDLDIRKAGGKWSVAGLEHIFNRPAGDKAPLALPVSAAALGVIPFDRLKVEDSHLGITSDAWSVTMPFRLEAEKTPTPRLAYAATGNVNFNYGNIAAIAEQAGADLALMAEDKVWAGRWTIGNARIAGLPEELPVLQGAGTINVNDAAQIIVEGGFASADQRYRLDFRYAGDLNNPQNAILAIIRAELPWKGGALAVRNTQIPVSGKNDLHFDLQVKDVSIDALLQAVTGKRVTATGQVSGSVPVTLARDGGFTLEKGILRAQGPGVIHMAPDSIPGDHAQIELVRAILSDLRYDRVSIETESAGNDNFAVLLALEGHNPAVYNGRAVKLNVRFTGDVLDFVQQNLMLLNHPEKLLKAGKK